MKRMLLLFCFCMIVIQPELKSQDRKKDLEVTVRVMTRNMYPGADLGILAGATESNIQAIAQTVIESIVESRIPERAALVAAEIATNRPDLVALQEVTRWTFPGRHGLVVLDQLELLMNSLRKAGEHYRIAIVQDLVEVDIPGLISYADHDAILVRCDLQMKVLGTEAHFFDTLLSFPALDGEISVLRGWVAADIRKGDRRFKFVTTHLEAPIPGMPETQDLQVAQAAQLVDDLQTTRLPVILAGDFNSDAEPTQGYPPDETPSYGLILQSGYRDAWTDLHEADPVYDFGYTWPLLEEGTGAATDPVERIDLVLLRGPQAVSIRRVGASPVRGLYASDHAGVVAVIRLTNSH
jgi:endonuclease/exonuclease/phosphatase family metal-dependent hydrolase